MHKLPFLYFTEGFTNCKSNLLVLSMGILGETMEDKQYKITVEVYGESYALKGTLEAERVKMIAALVDTKMNAIAKTNIGLSPTKVAVLAALNIADEYLRLENDFNQLVQMIKEVK